MARKTQQTAVTYLELDQAAAEQFDKYRAAQERERALGRTVAAHNKTRKEAQQFLETAFGESRTARLPDGRIIIRNASDRHRKAQPATDFQVVEFVEQVAE